MKRIFVKPQKPLVRKTQAEGFKPFKEEGEEVNLTKEITRLIKYGDLVEFKKGKNLKQK